MADTSKKHLGPVLWEDEKTRTWRDEWLALPAYEQKSKKCFKEIIVRFSSDEDYKDFQNRLEQQLSHKTKSIWHPKLDRTLAFEFDLLCVDTEDKEEWLSKPLTKDQTTKDSDIDEI